MNALPLHPMKVFTLLCLIAITIVNGFYPVSYSSSNQRSLSVFMTTGTKLSSILRKQLKNRPSPQDEIPVQLEESLTRTANDKKSTSMNKMDKAAIAESNYWINEIYGKNLSERAQIWNNHKHLSSVGDSGLTSKHINSVYQLALSHNYVKVKLSSHKLNSIEIAKQYLAEDSEESRKLAALVDTYEIRHRGILFRRKDLLPEKVIDRSLTPKPSAARNESDRQIRVRKEKRFRLGDQSADKSSKRVTSRKAVSKDER